MRPMPSTKVTAAPATLIEAAEKTYSGPGQCVCVFVVSIVSSGFGFHADLIGLGTRYFAILTTQSSNLLFSWRDSGTG